MVESQASSLSKPISRCTEDDVSLKAAVNAALAKRHTGLTVHVWREISPEGTLHLAQVYLGKRSGPPYRQAYPYTEKDLVDAARDWQSRLIEAGDRRETWTSNPDDADAMPDGWPRHWPDIDPEDL